MFCVQNAWIKSHSCSGEEEIEHKPGSVFVLHWGISAPYSWVQGGSSHQCFLLFLSDLLHMVIVVLWWCDPLWAQRKNKWICCPKPTGTNPIVRGVTNVAAELFLLKMIKTLEGSTAFQIWMEAALQLVSDILTLFFPKWCFPDRRLSSLRTTSIWP